MSLPLAGEGGVGVLPQTLVWRIDFPHPPRFGAQLRSRRHSRSFRFGVLIGTAAKAAYAPPQAGEVSEADVIDFT
jgi:hypothetical protein